LFGVESMSQSADPSKIRDPVDQHLTDRQNVT
jgi:hypothetical protein